MIRIQLIDSSREGIVRRYYLVYNSPKKLNCIRELNVIWSVYIILINLKSKRSSDLDHAETKNGTRNESF